MEIIILIIIIAIAIAVIKKFAISILTLSFLPGALHIYDGSMASYTIPIIGPIIEIIINYMVLLYINITDFILWFIHWIPGVRQIIDFVYTSPDMVERYLPNIFGGSGGHRNFITHSILNPVFLIVIGILFILIITLGNINNSIRSLLLFGLSILSNVFACHLLADTMPKSWNGFANIKIYFYSYVCTLPSVVSKLWLYINAFIALWITFKAIGKMEKE